MDPLFTNKIDAVLPRVLEQRGNERDPVPRRKRPAVPAKAATDDDLDQEPGSDTPKHAIDDLA